MNKSNQHILVLMALMSILDNMADTLPRDAAPLESFCDPQIWANLSEGMKETLRVTLDHWILVGLLNAMPVEFSTRGYVTDRDQI